MKSILKQVDGGAYMQVEPYNRNFVFGFQVKKPVKGWACRGLRSGGGERGVGA